MASLLQIPDGQRSKDLEMKHCRSVTCSVSSCNGFINLSRLKKIFPKKKNKMNSIQSVAKTVLRRKNRISEERRANESFGSAVNRLYKTLSPAGPCDGEIDFLTQEPIPKNERLILKSHTGNKQFCFNVSSLVTMFQARKFYNPYISHEAFWNPSDFVKIIRKMFEAVDRGLEAQDYAMKLFSLQTELCFRIKISLELSQQFMCDDCEDFSWYCLLPFCSLNSGDQDLITSETLLGSLALRAVMNNLKVERLYEGWFSIDEISQKNGPLEDIRAGRCTSKFFDGTANGLFMVVQDPHKDATLRYSFHDIVDKTKWQRRYNSIYEDPQFIDFEFY